MPTLTLRITGNATLPKLAEQANLRPLSSSSGYNKQAVSDEVLTTAKYIEDMIKEAETQVTSSTQTSAVSHWTQTALSTGSWLEHIPLTLARGQGLAVEGAGAVHFNRNSSLFASNPRGTNDDTLVAVRRHSAQVEFDVRFRDFAILSQFSSHLTSIDHCEIKSLNWVLLPATEARYKSQLRIEAASDARAKVRDYCQVVCPGVNVLIVPTEMGSENVAGGLFSAAGKYQDPRMSSFAAFAGNSAEPPTNNRRELELSFAPQEIKMSLSADFVFTVETGGFRMSEISTETDYLEAGGQK